MESCRGPALLRRGFGYMRPCPAEVVHCFVAAVAPTWTHGPHAAALHDSQCMHQHPQVVAHHADRAAPWGGFPVQGHSCCQRIGDTSHDCVLHPCIWTSGRRGDQNAGTYC